MKIPNRKVIIGIVLAYILWYFVFLVDTLNSIWYRVTFASLILTVYVNTDNELPSFISLSEVVYGLGSGILLYALFYIGFNLFRPLVAEGVFNVYLFRNELPLIFPAILLILTSFCEEYFWRGFTQKNLIETYGKSGVLITSILYASIHLPTFNFPLIMAALLAGLAWGILYEYTDSFWIIVFSHIAWAELIFVLLPLG